MKLAFIVDSFPTLSETFVLNQITGLIDLGHDVYIFAGSRPKENSCIPELTNYQLKNKIIYHNDKPKNIFLRYLSAIGILIKLFPKGIAPLVTSLSFSIYKENALSLAYFYKAQAFLQHQPFDAVICHFGQNGNLAVTLKELGAIHGKIITFFHGADLSKRLNVQEPTFYHDLISKGDIFLPISHFWQEKLIELGFSKKRIMIHKMGIDLKKFTFHQHKLNPDKINILSIGRLVEKKGFQYSIEAITNLIQQGHAIKYTIIGDGPLKESLAQLISNLKMTEHIILLGSQPHETIKEYIQQSDLLLAPSVTATNGDQEGIPVVLMEAMASGLPVLSTYHSGIPELINDGITGFLVEENKPDQIAKKIKELITDHSKLEDISLAARDFIKNNHDIIVLNKTLCEIISNE